MTTPESASGITFDWLNKVLPREHPDCELTSIEVEPDFGGPSLLGRIARVKLTYATPGCGPESVIVKFQVQNSDWEAQIFRLLADVEVTTVPQMYGAFEHGTLILEDLSPAQPGSQVEGCTLQQTQDVLSLLADIHGRFWGDQRVPSIEPAKFAGVIEYNMEQCWKPFQERYGELLGEAASDFEWMRDNARTVSAHRLSAPSTLFHGDVHPENLLFPQDGKDPPVLIDWQLAGRGLAANDVSFFLVKSLTVNDRRANEDRLLTRYFESLPEQARLAYGYDDFVLDYRACVTRSMLSAVMLAGPRFADRPDRYDLADALATRVIAAVKDHKPADATSSAMTHRADTTSAPPTS